MTPRPRPPPDQLPQSRGVPAPGARPDRRRVRGRRQDPGPPAQPPRARPLRRDVERALLLQVVPAPPAAAAHGGAQGARRPGRERRRDRRRRRHRHRHPDREPQPPLGDRALPGGGHRRGRHPARHLHHGRPPARRHGPALLRPSRRRPAALARRGRRERDLGLRQLGGGADRRRRADLRPLLRPEPARQRALHGRAAHRAPRARHRVGPGQPGRAARLDHGARRHRRGERPGLRRVQRGRGRRTTPRDPASRWAIPSRRSA